MTKITSEHTCCSLKEQSFCPQDASPSWQSGFLPLSCPLVPGSPNNSICRISPISGSPRPSQLQCYLYQQPHSHDPRTSALSVHPRLDFCVPVICTKFFVTPKSPSWTFRPRGDPETLGVTSLPLLSAVHTLTRPQLGPDPLVPLFTQCRHPSGFCFWGLCCCCFIMGSLKIC